jgi:hypothetical protein
VASENHESLQGNDGVSNPSQKVQSANCCNYQTISSSLQILEENILHLKEEFLHSYIHGEQDSSIGTTIQQLRSDVNTLRATVNEQNEMLASLAERCCGKQNDSTNNKTLYQTTQGLRSNKDKIVKLETGQDNIAAALKTLSNKVFSNIPPDHD